MTIYHRYRKDNNYYWGSTRTLNDDPDCEYVTVEPPPRDPFAEVVIWNGTGWDVVAI